MMQTFLFFLHYGALLLFGIVLSAAFARVQVFARRNLPVFGLVFLLSCGLQLAALFLLGEELVWKLYPVITHLPLLCVLWLGYRKRFVTALAAVCSAYLCCQPVKWIGLLSYAIWKSIAVEYVVRILALGAMAFVSLRWLCESLSQIFTKDPRDVWIFASVPLVYYLFDYSMGIYTDLWAGNNQLAMEFLPFFLCMIFLLFCFVYYKQYEQKADAQRSEQIVRMTTEQQAKELALLRRSEKEVKILRHDMRLLLASLAVCIQEGDREKAREMIDSHISRIDGTTYRRFCENDTLNYVLSDFLARCQAESIPFHYQVEAAGLDTDEILLCSILSNALDNARNAQAALPEEKRSIRLLLKNADGRLLLSVVNPILEPPLFVDGLPVASRKDHGYGTQSIRYLSQRLGGKCQFLVEDGQFITRVIL